VRGIAAGARRVRRPADDDDEPTAEVHDVLPSRPSSEPLAPESNPSVGSAQPRTKGFPIPWITNDEGPGFTPSPTMIAIAGISAVVIVCLWIAGCLFMRSH
jgi:hypothetical protein